MLLFNMALELSVGLWCECCGCCSCGGGGALWSRIALLVVAGWCVDAFVALCSCCAEVTLVFAEATADGGALLPPPLNAVCCVSFAPQLLAWYSDDRVSNGSVYCGGVAALAYGAHWDANIGAGALYAAPCTLEEDDDG